MYVTMLPEWLSEIKGDLVLNTRPFIFLTGVTLLLLACHPGLLYDLIVKYL